MCVRDLCRVFEADSLPLEWGLGFGHFSLGS